MFHKNIFSRAVVKNSQKAADAWNVNMTPARRSSMQNRSYGKRKQAYLLCTTSIHGWTLGLTSQLLETA